jgi:gluconolactonase
MLQTDSVFLCAFFEFSAVNFFIFSNCLPTSTDKTTMKKTITSLCFVVISFTAFAQNVTPYDTTAKPQLIARQFSFTEGASTDKMGNVFFTDQPNNKIWEYDINGKLSVFLDSAGRSNGMYFDAKGNLISCADEHDQVWSISPKKKIKVLVTGINGKLLNGPNDLWVAPNGGIYMTDPYYQRDYWTRKTSDLDGQKVYYLPKNSHTPIVVDDKLKQPNGIVGTPDGNYLYVSDIADHKTYKYTINADGSLVNRTLIINQGSDGMTLDEKGNIYLTGNGVTIYDPQGNKMGHIAINEPWTSNLCFAGKNKDVLFITATTAIYTLQMKVRGVE